MTARRNSSRPSRPASDASERSSGGTRPDGFLAHRARLGLGKADEREMAERRHRSPLDQVHALGPLGPAHESSPGKLQPPTQLVRHRREAMFDNAAQPLISADAADQHDLAP